MWLRLEFVICQQQRTAGHSRLSVLLQATIKDQFCPSTNASVSDCHSGVTCSGPSLFLLEDLQMEKKKNRLVIYRENPKGKKKKKKSGLAPFGTSREESFLLPGQTKGHWLWENLGSNSWLGKRHANGRYQRKCLEKRNGISPRLAWFL